MAPFLCQPRPYDPTPHERRLDIWGAPEAGLRGPLTSPPMSWETNLCPPLSELTDAVWGPSLAGPLLGRPTRSTVPSSPSGRGQGQADMGRKRRWEPREGRGSPSCPLCASPGLSQRFGPLRPCLSAPQAHLILSHGIQSGQVCRQHQVSLDSLVDLHKDRAILRGAAIRSQVHLHARGGCMRAGPHVDGPRGCPAPALASP